MCTLPPLGTSSSRRVVLASLAGLLAGCAIVDWDVPSLTGPIDQADFDPRYGPISDNGQQIPAVDFGEIDHELLRATVPYKTLHRPGTLLVDIAARRLHFVQTGGFATRYAVGVGREEALNFSGSATIGRKEQWPRWTPTASMIERIPRYAAYAGGMPGGVENPLGARALYLYRDGKDTQFRIHGTNEPASIGTAVSSGCIRMLNQDIIDLYSRVPIGAPVVVGQQGGSIGPAIY